MEQNCMEQKLKKEVKEILEQYTTAKDNLVPILNDIIKLEEHKSHATALAIIVFLTAASSSIYIFKGTYDFQLTWRVAIGSIVGGIIGAKLLCKVTGKFLRIIFM